MAHEYFNEDGTIKKYICHNLALELDDFKVNEYCIESISTIYYTTINCPHCIIGNHSDSKVALYFKEIYKLDDTFPKKLQKCVICNKDKCNASLYFLPGYFEEHIEHSFQICLECLQHKKDLVCEKLDLIFRIVQYIVNIDRNIKEHDEIIYNSNLTKVIRMLYNNIYLII